MDNINISFDLTDWKIRILEKRNGRMKVIINLTKDEGVAFKNFSEMFKPEDADDNQFMKVIFLMGMEACQQRVAEMVQDYAVENKDDLASSGIEVITDEDGKVRLAQAPSPSSSPYVQTDVPA